MKKIALAFLALLSFALIAGCLDGGGGGGGGSNYLTAGDYLTSGGAVAVDGCELGITPAGLNGDILTVTTGAGIVTIDGDDYNRSGNSFALTQNLPGTQINATCTIDLVLVDTGSITANDAFAMSQEINVSNPTGTDCSVIPATVTFPCTSRASFQANLQ